MSRALAWKRKANSMMGKGQNGSSSLQLAKAAIYLPAIAVTASGAHIFKTQAKGEPLPPCNPLFDIIYRS
jgi:hypothetical protein